MPHKSGISYVRSKHARIYIYIQYLGHVITSNLWQCVCLPIKQHQSATPLVATVWSTPEARLITEPLRSVGSVALEAIRIRNWLDTT